MPFNQPAEELRYTGPGPLLKSPLPVSPVCFGWWLFFWVKDGSTIVPLRHDICDVATHVFRGMFGSFVFDQSPYSKRSFFLALCCCAEARLPDRVADCCTLFVQLRRWVAPAFHPVIVSVNVPLAPSMWRCNDRVDMKKPDD